MWRKYLFVISAIFLLGGFASISDEMRGQLKSLPQQYSQFDVNMAWAVKSSDRNTLISGVVQNVRYATMEELEIWVALHDVKGKLLSKAVSFVIPRRLDRDETAPFSVTLPVIASPGSKLMFTYKYNGFDGGGDGGMAGGGVSWIQSFEAQVPGSP